MGKIVDVTAYISTKGRYDTTLPLAISSIATQTVSPKKFILFEDGPPVDIRQNSMYSHILHILNDKGIEWEVVFGKQQGQVHNHQLAIDKCKTEWLWRVDDDNIAESNVLENLLNSADEKTGAVAGLVLDPTQIQLSSIEFTNKIETIYTQNNVQWLKHERTDIFEAEHLYSSFIYRRKASSHGYCTNLSPVGHREETIFSYEMFRSGWKLLINPNVITWHLREPTGGIRTYTDSAYWNSDEDIFTKKMQSWKTPFPGSPYHVVLDSGLGDHFLFSSLIPQLKKKHGDNLVIACCYPDVFQESGVKLISIQSAKDKLNDIDKYNIYRYCGERHWRKPLIEAYKEMYGI